MVNSPCRIVNNSQNDQRSQTNSGPIFRFWECPGPFCLTSLRGGAVGSLDQKLVRFPRPVLSEGSLCPVFCRTSPSLSRDLCESSQLPALPIRRREAGAHLFVKIDKIGTSTEVSVLKRCYCWLSAARALGCPYQDMSQTGASKAANPKNQKVALFMASSFRRRPCSAFTCRASLGAVGS
jgi:hypothetical protein